MKAYITNRIYLMLFFCSITIMAQAQQKFEISGIVQDETGQPVPGVSVYVKDKTGIGTNTDMDGKFVLKVDRGDKVQFSFIGYTRHEYLALKTEKKLVIQLVPDVSALDEVVVEAYGSKTRKITTTGAVTSVDVATLQTPATSLANMLGGRVAGIISTQGSGEPGKNISDFWIRGIGTFGANASALVLIDGLEGSLNDVDPADIESFSVLKDASATAMYGVRGANGVVLVTTKRGKQEKLSFTARANATISWLKRLPEYCDGYNYAKLANEALVVRGDDPKYTNQELDIIKYGLDTDLYPDVNWQDEVLKRSYWQQTYYLSARGGGSIARYFISLNGSNETSAYQQDKSSKYFKGLAYNTFGLRANIDIDLTKTTKLYFGVNANKTIRNLPGAADTNLIWSACSKLTPVTIPVVYSNGMLPSANGVTDEMSPYVLLNHTGLKQEEEFTSTYTLSLDQDLGMLIKGLKLNIQGAYTNDNAFHETRYIIPELWSYDKRNATGELAGKRQTERITTQYSKWEMQYRKYFLQATMNWAHDLGHGHTLTALAHYEMSDQKRSTDANDTMSAIPVRYQGLSAKVGYNYNDTYIVDGNFGYTGSENFQPGRQFGFFPSISGAWVPSSYQWTKDKMPWLNYFKIRASYGLVGNDRITDKRFPYLTSINVNGSATTNWKYTKGGIWENSIGADNLEWEKAKKFDVGLEGKLFDKFEFVIDCFRDTRDGIFQERKQVPDFVGLVNMPFGNVGSMVSWGSDGNITFNQRINKDMEFTLRANFTYSTNKVNYYEEGDTKYEYTSATGRPNGYMKGYIALGLFKDQEEINNSPKQDFGSYLPGDIKYKDVNGDGVVNSDDQVPVSYQDYPRLMYGFGGEFRWKKLTLGVRFSGIGNTDYYKIWTWGSNNVGYIPFYDGKLGNVLTIAANPANRWIPADYDDPSIPASMRENPNAMFPRLSYGSNQNNAQASTFWKGNRKYLRLDEISLNYNCNCNLLKSIGINSIDLAVVANDLHTWDSVKLFDPELATSNGRAYPIPGRVSFQAIVHF